METLNDQSDSTDLWMSSRTQSDVCVDRPRTLDVGRCAVYGNVYEGIFCPSDMSNEGNLFTQFDEFIHAEQLAGPIFDVENEAPTAAPYFPDENGTLDSEQGQRKLGTDMSFFCEFPRHDEMGFSRTNYNIETVQDQAGVNPAEIGQIRSAMRRDNLATSNYNCEVKIFQAGKIGVPEAHISQIEGPAEGSCSLIISGLPRGTTMAHIESLLAWSSSFIKGRILPRDSENVEEFEAAALYFSSPAGAWRAQELLDGMPNIAKSALMHIKMGPIPQSIYPSRDNADIPQLPLGQLSFVDKDRVIRETMTSSEPSSCPATKRHKFTDEDKTYLKMQFQQNPKPSTEACVEIARRLDTEVKRVRTWFNNCRQRQQRESKKLCANSCTADASISSMNPIAIPIAASVSRKNLESLDRLQKSPQNSEICLSPSSIPSSVTSWLSIPCILSEADVMDTIKSVASINRDEVQCQPLDQSQMSAFSKFEKGPSHTRYAVSHGTDSKSVFSVASGISSHSRSSVISSRSQCSSVSRRLTKTRHRTKSNPVTKPSTQTTPPRVLIDLTCNRCHTPFQIDIREDIEESFNCPNCRESSEKNDCLVKSFGVGFKITCSTCGEKSCHSYRHKSRDDDLPLIYHCPRCRSRAFSMLFSNPYQCTFCRQRYSKKFTWWRHEEALHQPQEAWICCKDGYLPQLVVDTATGQQSTDAGQCALCSSTQVTLEDHLAKAHRFKQCLERPIRHRTFFRKDQLSQHLRTFHKCAIKEQSLLSRWHTKLNQESSSYDCGICGETLTSWSKRMKHIGDHWDNGYDMKYWMDDRTEGEIRITPELGNFGGRPQSWRKTSTFGMRAHNVNSDNQTPEQPSSKSLVSWFWGGFKYILPS